MSTIQEYWAGVLQRLEAEVSIFARLVLHHGERGRGNEAALGRVLEPLSRGATESDRVSSSTPGTATVGKRIS